MFVTNLGVTSYACASEVAAGNMERDQVVNFMIQVACHVFFEFQGLIQMLPRIVDMLMPLSRIAVHLDSQSKIEPNPNDPAHCPFEVVCNSAEECKQLISKLKTVDCSKITSQFHEGPTRAFGKYVQATDALDATNGTVKVGAKLLHVIACTGEEDPVFTVAELETKLAERSDKRGAFPMRLVFSRYGHTDFFFSSSFFLLGGGGAEERDPSGCFYQEKLYLVLDSMYYSKDNCEEKPSIVWAGCTCPIISVGRSSLTMSSSTIQRTFAHVSSTACHLRSSRDRRLVSVVRQVAARAPHFS